MKNFRNIAMTLVLLIAGALNVCLAQTSAAGVAVYEEKTFFSNLHFRLNKANLDEEYLTNSVMLDSLQLMIDSIGRENISMIEVVSNASPEGVLERNLWLAEHRGSAIEYYICRTYPELCGLMVVSPSGESWGELREMVAADPILSKDSKDKVFAIIDSNVNVGTKKWRMQNTLGTDAVAGNIYDYIINNIYKLIRNAGVKLYYNAAMISDSIQAEETAESIMADTTATAQAADTTAIAQATDTTAIAAAEAAESEQMAVAEQITEATAAQTEIQPESEKEPREAMLSVKTNLLYDAAYIPNQGFKPALNVEAEYYFRNSNWSALAEFDSPWYSDPETHFYFQIQNFQLEGRRYLNLGKNSVQNSHNGLYVSAYAMFNMYDLCFNEDGNGKQGEGAGAGIGLGYVMPISKNGKWKLEFSLKAGYYESHYDNYHYGVNEKGQGKYFYDWDGEADDFIRRNWRFRWVGPTSVGVTLSYDILSRKVK